MRIAVTFAAAAILATAAAGAAFAQAEAIKQRQEVMKAVGGSLGTLVKMVKGEEAYDSAKAKAAVETISTRTKGFDALFPVGSEKGGDTEAAAKIWTDTAGFKAALAKLQETTAAQTAVAARDLDGTKAAVGALGGACKGCHDNYRVKK